MTNADNFVIQVANAATASSSFAMNEATPNSFITLLSVLCLLASAMVLASMVPAPTVMAPVQAQCRSAARSRQRIGLAIIGEQILLACPEGGGIYYWDPTGGFTNASIISTGPAFNNGIFVSMGEQIVVAYGSTIHVGIGYQQQPMLVQWCDVGNFFQWAATAATQAGNYTIPIGSEIVAGLAVSNQNLIFTDLDLWAMNYIGPPNVFGFTKIGAGMGAVSSHSVQQLRGSVYWMGRTNFYSYTSGGANALPCPVWDSVFQNINTNFLHNVRAMPNTPYNEVGWLYPSAASTSGECDSYAKMNITEQGAPWDIGPLPRSAWIDQTILGMPIGAAPNGFVYQHETTNDADGAPLNSSFTTGFFYLAEGEEFVFVDQIIPDFRWNEYTGGASAQILLTFNVTNYPGDTPVVYGPYLGNPSYRVFVRSFQRASDEHYSPIKRSRVLLAHGELQVPVFPGRETLNERSNSSPRHSRRHGCRRTTARYYPATIGLGFGLQGTNHLGVIYDGGGGDYRGAADRGAIDLEYYVDGDQCCCGHACRISTFAVYFRDLSWCFVYGCDGRRR